MSLSAFLPSVLFTFPFLHVASTHRKLGVQIKIVRTFFKKKVTVIMYMFRDMLYASIQVTQPSTFKLSNVGKAYTLISFSLVLLSFVQVDDQQFEKGEEGVKGWDWLQCYQCHSHYSSCQVTSELWVLLLLGLLSGQLNQGNGKNCCTWLHVLVALVVHHHCRVWCEMDLLHH